MEKSKKENGDKYKYFTDEILNYMSNNNVTNEAKGDTDYVLPETHSGDEEEDYISSSSRTKSTIVLKKIPMASKELERKSHF